MNDALPRHTAAALPQIPREHFDTAHLVLSELFENARDTASLFHSFEHACVALGFPFYAISRVVRSRSRACDQTRLEVICAHYPDHWVRHYQRRDYASIDPIHRAAFTTAMPYRWMDIASLSGAERRFLLEANEAGLSPGLSVPIHQPGGGILLFNFSGPSQSVIAGLNSHLPYLVSAQTHFELQRLAPLSPRRSVPYLTARQRECLRWVACGKTSWEIGAILQISPNTVDDHIREAMKTLNVHRRAAAAVLASELGLLET